MPYPADALPEPPSLHDPHLEEIQNPVDEPAEGLEDLGLVGSGEGYQPFAPSPSPLPSQGDPGDEDDARDADDDTPSRTRPAHALAMAPAVTLSCRDLEARGLWDTEDCCHALCHAHDDLRPAPLRVGRVTVAGCCHANAALDRARPDAFVATLFGP